ncbi:hypothetical protein MMC28_005744 [Mycoblastus sanguinarius]|nr:hypothetical protein [Mycoblastus sanguinarius]
MSGDPPTVIVDQMCSSIEENCHSKDSDIYAEWAIFIDSVKGNLQHLEYEQGPRSTLIWSGGLVLHWNATHFQPMDNRFLRALFPILAGSVVMSGELEDQGGTDVANIFLRGRWSRSCGGGLEEESRMSRARPTLLFFLRAPIHFQVLPAPFSSHKNINLGRTQTSHRWRWGARVMCHVGMGLT